MKKFFRRLLIGLFFALPIAGLVLFLAHTRADARAASQEIPPTPTRVVSGATYESCVACHKDIVDKWALGPHGQSMTDPVFTQEWNSQGQPGACLVCHTTGYDPASGASQADSVSCEACHSPIPANHPTEKMPVDKSTDLCGRCHSDPRFSTESFTMSAHYKRDMSCVVCHDQHSAGMRTVAGVANTTGDASDLCANCHKDAMKNFPASKHAEAGVTCVNCHLGFNIADKNVSLTEAHRAPDHNFIPSLETCNKCHANQMHAPGEAAAAAAIKVEEVGGTPTAEPSPVATAVPAVDDKPLPVSPLGFAAMAGLLGLAGGMVLAPWLEKSYRHLTKGGKND